ncbi:MAG: pyridoxamine 5'-phosphate oxidase family protein [Actinomycetota bacterium]
MGSEPELEAMARRIIDGNPYMTMATADGEGRPWVTPVYFNPDGSQDLYWISSPDAQHSRNLAVRSDVSIVVFDSQVRIGDAEAVYIRAHAQEVTEPTLGDCAVAFRARFEGVRTFAPDELRAPAKLRLYRATAAEHWVLIRGNDPIWGRGIDSRLAVTLA